MKHHAVRAFILTLALALAGGVAWGQMPPMPGAAEENDEPIPLPETPAVVAPPADPQLEQDVPLPLQTEKQRISYALGFQMGGSYATRSYEIDIEHYVGGLRDGLKGEDARLGPDDMDEILNTIRERMFSLEQQRKQSEALEQMMVGRQFLMQNRDAEGVRQTESGLQYKVVTEGSGPIPTLDDTVRVHYKGTLVDDKQFDSSYDRGKPAELPVSGVIKGWSEALQMMPVGSKWEVFVPSELAYGQLGQPPAIPPNAVLKFEVELLDIISD